MFMRFKNWPLWLVLLVLTVALLRAPAIAASDPGAFVTSLTQNAFDTLRDPALSEQDRFSKFRMLLNQNVDMPRIGRFVLAANWKRANEAQQAEYQQLFSDYVIAAYAGRLKDYTDSQISIKNITAMEKSEFIVSSQITNSKNPKPVQVDWRLRETEGELRMLDMTIEGISMALTQRSEFSAIIQQNNGDINALLTRLRSAAGPIAQGKPATVTN